MFIVVDIAIKDAINTALLRSIANTIQRDIQPINRKCVPNRRRCYQQTRVSEPPYPVLLTNPTLEYRGWIVIPVVHFVILLYLSS